MVRRDAHGREHLHARVALGLLVLLADRLLCRLQQTRLETAHKGAQPGRLQGPRAPPRQRAAAQVRRGERAGYALLGRQGAGGREGRRQRPSQALQDQGGADGPRAQRLHAPLLLRGQRPAHTVRALHAAPRDHVHVPRGNCDPLRQGRLRRGRYRHARRVPHHRDLSLLHLPAQVRAASPPPHRAHQLYRQYARRTAHRPGAARAEDGPRAAHARAAAVHEKGGGREGSLHMRHDAPLRPGHVRRPGEEEATTLRRGKGTWRP
mmetsp:Transcript_21616/g.66064  ORF Transcript_21616/g.66064 Transcript_21616/m.66064 type:complete len:264 (-) Transcript_21616:2048-2839(-)